MDYSFIKDVKVIDEKTIEYETYVETVYELPKEFKTVKGNNYTYGLIADKSIMFYVNGEFLEYVKNIDVFKVCPDILPCDEQQKYHLRITFA